MRTAGFVFFNVALFLALALWVITFIVIRKRK